jgi:hypothetical protein
MKEISLTQGQVALVDDEDYDYLMQWKWHFYKGTHSHYAVCSLPRKNGKRTGFRMHRLIMNTPPDLVVDHIDHNGLNNQKSNLRNCTKCQNQANI